ncbi:hypothetical protein GCM10009850_075160 [Nonomuraea monospora]|uniref:Secreted protein n=1 Tax=Nonomuraea monospora TaxID=568818 RepID=A0ABN3CRH4_9ACTN
MRLRALAAALCTVLLAAPAAADTPDPVTALAAAPGGDTGKLCISVPVGAMAQAFNAFLASLAAPSQVGQAPSGPVVPENMLVLQAAPC